MVLVSEIPVPMQYVSTIGVSAVLKGFNASGLADGQPTDLLFEFSEDLRAVSTRLLIPEAGKDRLNPEAAFSLSFCYMPGRWQRKGLLACGAQGTQGASLF